MWWSEMARLSVGCMALGSLVLGASGGGSQIVLDRLNQDASYSKLAEAEFYKLGWELPDRGRLVKAAADAAAGGAFDPQQLEKMPAATLGYRARWHAVRYSHYGLDWDITGLELVPESPVADLPTVAIIHGGSANWYEFFVDPLNNPGVGQYLAQKVRVLLITIPGNYKPRGWSQPPDRRVPEYLVGSKLSDDEVKLRNAIYTTKLVATGVERLLEEVTSGPIVVIGHSTGGEIPFLLRSSSLGPRIASMFLGWGSGGPAGILEENAPSAGTAAVAVHPVWRLRVRTAEEYTKNYSYVGPLNPIAGESKLAVAKQWFAQEERRRPQFKQVLQDAEHRPGRGSLDELVPQIRMVVDKSKLSVDVEQVIADLFSTHRVPLTNFSRMLWLVAREDAGHWNRSRPEKSLEMLFAARFRAANPNALIRVLVLDLPLSHYGHIERPRQLAGVLLESLRWVAGSKNGSGRSDGSGQSIGTW